MPGPFDTTTKLLVQQYPSDWLSFLGFDTVDAVEVVDADLSIVSAEVDKVVRVGGAAPWLVHLEFQSSYDATMGERLVRYSTMLHLQHRLPVASILILLRPAADGPAISGRHQVALPGSEPYLSFGYGVRRLWQEPVSRYVNGALGTLPLAPLAAVSDTELPGLLRAIERRFVEEETVARAEALLIVTYTLLGMRFPPAIVDQLMPGIRNMRDSSTYQAIVEEGRAEGLARGRAEGERRLLILFGEARLGPTDAEARSRLNSITDVAVLEQLAQRLLTVSSWAELLADQP